MHIIHTAVLDYGYIRLIDFMGDDLNPVEAARMSTDNPTGVNTAKDDSLRERLWKDLHTSPYEMNVACFELQLPIFVLRQIDRHRTLDLTNPEIVESTDYDEFRKFTSRNEFSGRYAVMPDLYYTPSEERMATAGQSRINKQGSGTALGRDIVKSSCREIEGATKDSRDTYNTLVQDGVANEIARLVLPGNQYTKIRIQASMLAWFKFCALRLPEEAQWETRQYAKAMATCLRDMWPKCWEVFEEHTLYATSLSRTDRQALAAALVQLGSGMTEDWAKSDIEHLLTMALVRTGMITDKKAESLVRKLVSPQLTDLVGHAG